MNIWAAIPLVTCLFYLLLLFFIIQNVKKRANKVFAYYIGIAAFWSFSSFMLHSSTPRLYGGAGPDAPLPGYRDAAGGGTP